MRALPATNASLVEFDGLGHAKEGMQIDNPHGVAMILGGAALAIATGFSFWVELVAIPKCMVISKEEVKRTFFFQTPHHAMLLSSQTCQCSDTGRCCMALGAGLVGGPRANNRMRGCRVAARVQTRMSP